ncbi:MAG TPA: hypothetical protein VM597_27340 [Gemmataceae bacterium]|jgi:hypothetical protein|nr:hypothetical protein [Gemmataceae bacterium]
MFPVFAQYSSSMARDGMVLGGILGSALAVAVCAGLVFVTAVSQGKVGLGVIGALIAVPVAGMYGCLGGLPIAVVLCLIITVIPRFNRPLLSEAEVEAEMRRARML